MQSHAVMRQNEKLALGAKAVVSSVHVTSSSVTAMMATHWRGVNSARQGLGRFSEHFPRGARTVLILMDAPAIMARMPS
jgi:hypothetical protein